MRQPGEGSAPGGRRRGRARNRRYAVVLASVATVAVAAACGGSGGGTSSAANTTTAPGSATSAGSMAGSAGSPAAKGTMVTVTETDFHLALSTTHFTPGTYTFVAKDAGHTTHALEINGPGVTDKATGALGPGDSQSLTVTLVKGSYELWCPVDGHKGLGMDTHITVG